jgi:hypothetical protein
MELEEDPTNRFDMLPPELQIYVYGFDRTYRDAFDKCINEMKQMLRLRVTLKFKKRYQKFFGKASYAHVHSGTALTTDHGHYRVANIQVLYDLYSNSIMLSAWKLLLFMKINRAFSYDEYSYDDFYCYQSDIHDLHDHPDSDSDEIEDQ